MGFSAEVNKSRGPNIIAGTARLVHWTGAVSLRIQNPDDLLTLEELGTGAVPEGEHADGVFALGQRDRDGQDRIQERSSVARRYGPWCRIAGRTAALGGEGPGDVETPAAVERQRSVERAVRAVELD